MDHTKSREKVCACCQNDSGKKPSRLMNANLETELKKLLPGYDRSDNRYPSGICEACRRALSDFKSGKSSTVPHFKPYDPAPINVDGRHKCTCFMCCKAKLPVSKFSPEKSKPPQKIELPDKCAECFTTRGKGIEHNESVCNKTTLIGNILSLDDEVLDMVVAEHLKRKGTGEILLKQLGGGAHPLIVNLGKHVTEGCTKILSHEEIDIIQKDLQLSVTKMRELLRLIRAAFGPHSVQPYWREACYEETEKYEQFFTIEDLQFQDNKGNPQLEPFGFSTDVPALFEEVTGER